MIRLCRLLSGLLLICGAGLLADASAGANPAAGPRTPAVVARVIAATNQAPYEIVKRHITYRYSSKGPLVTLPNLTTVIDRPAHALETFDNGRLIYVHVGGVWYAARRTAAVTSQLVDRGVCFFRPPITGEAADGYTAAALPSDAVYRFPSAGQIDWTTGPGHVTTDRVLVTPASDRIAKWISASGAGTQTSAFSYPRAVQTIAAPTDLCARAQVR